MFVPFEDPLVGHDADGSERNKKRSMQLILDEIHALQREWEKDGGEEWAAASTINSSKVLIVTVSPHGPDPREIESLFRSRRRKDRSSSADKGVHGTTR